MSASTKAQSKPVVQRLLRPVTLSWQRLPLMDRWLTGELLGPLLFGVAAFTAVSLSVGVVFELVRRVAESGLPLLTALQVLGLRMPGFLVLSFPMATLMATLLAYSTLSSNSELIALRSVGVSTWRMVLPALIVAVLMSLLTFMFNDLIVPSANLEASNTLNQALGKAIAAEKGSNIIYSRFSRRPSKLDESGSERYLSQLFYSRQFKDGEMEEVTVLDFSSPSGTQILKAKKGIWNEGAGMWEFLDGQIVLVGDSENTTSAKFDRYLYPLDQGPLKLAALPKDAAAMSVSQAMRAETLLREAGDQKEARRMRVRIQEKFAFPAICLVFGLIGSSLGVRPNARTSRSQGFGISVLLIFSYYLMSFIFSSLGVKGTLGPLLAAWSPVLIGLLLGLLLLRQASR
ncbi:LptF/LptG family permease [Synechococcus sp. Cruz-9H2]|uniref:LptF/LptG family permease n=1 Tax=unclassified Synechococcus TaxID=2626047 RepID=UPI0020CF0E78|nr:MULTISPECIES: LptF/LptG family permease [unclassified Synechococcus]MCP9817915.1 LptF/LptG family permease [Synechococcus sp. Cruz-9H2]MCP9842585.1 LptF/LptG family permease [Synechococcus sp. Edmonson 11F2]MCP9854311.1 LptF/LptG family permease [Synechococcus sp. Cruz-9C9]MCP9861993.1 LptF/LptG family permease [Synechococcus sp. Cruz-7E5]MCP9868823.1 LptF/LptG family permease [Synechococcus sp. Cruz-7B9]